jgi:hypothetical protein
VERVLLRDMVVMNEDLETWNERLVFYRRGLIPSRGTGCQFEFEPNNVWVSIIDKFVLLLYEIWCKRSRTGV